MTVLLQYIVTEIARCHTAHVVLELLVEWKVSWTLLNTAKGTANVHILTWIEELPHFRFLTSVQCRRTQRPADACKQGLISSLISWLLTGQGLELRWRCGPLTLHFLSDVTESVGGIILQGAGGYRRKLTLANKLYLVLINKDGSHVDEGSIFDEITFGLKNLLFHPNLWRQKKTMEHQNAQN